MIEETLFVPEKLYRRRDLRSRWGGQQQSLVAQGITLAHGVTGSYPTPVARPSDTRCLNAVCTVPKIPTSA
jgi:hypothetical protein